MSAYANLPKPRALLELGPAPHQGPESRPERGWPGRSSIGGTEAAGLVDALVERLAQRVATRSERLREHHVDAVDEWLDSRQAAEYLGLHRNTLRRLAAGRATPSSRTVAAASSSFDAPLSTRGGVPAVVRGTWQRSRLLFACRWSGANPVSLMIPSERPKRSLCNRRRIFEGRELEQTVAAATELYRTLFTLAALTGARGSELLGLEWADVRPAHVDDAEIEWG
jgi:integrase